MQLQIQNQLSIYVIGELSSFLLLIFFIPMSSDFWAEQWYNFFFLWYCSILTQCSVNTDLIYGELANRLMNKNRENDVIDLIKYIKESVPEPHSIVDNVARVTIKAKPKNIDVFINSITDDVLKVNKLFYVSCMNIECHYRYIKSKLCK